MEPGVKYCPCIIQIPLRYGSDGREVESETIVKFLSVFSRQFGGYTPLGITQTPEGVPSGGLWHGEEDVSLRIEIAVAPERTGEFEAVAYSIGKELEQKEMYIHIGEPIAKFLKIVNGEDDKNGNGASQESEANDGTSK